MTHNAKTQFSLQLPVDFKEESYIPTESAYPNADGYTAEAYKIVKDNGNDTYEVEVDDDGDPVSYTVYWNQLDDYDPSEQAEDSACDWFEASNVIKR